MRKLLSFILILACTVVLWASQADASDKIVIRFAHSNTPSDMDPYHALVNKMRNKLAQKLGPDRIDLQDFPAGQIGSEDRSFSLPPLAPLICPISSRLLKNSTSA